MKNLFYLNFENKEFLEKKCLTTKYTKDLKGKIKPEILLTGARHKRRHKRVSVKRVKKTKILFFNTAVIVRVRFSRDLFIQSFFVSHQTNFADFATRYKDSIQILKKQPRFATARILRSKKGGFFVRAVTFRCFLPRRHFCHFWERTANGFDSFLINSWAKSILVYVLKVSRAVPVGTEFFFWLLENFYLIRERLLKKKCTLNPRLASNKIPLHSFYTRFRYTHSYYRKKFLKKRRRWRHRLNIVILLKGFKQKKNRRFLRRKIRSCGPVYKSKKK